MEEEGGWRSIASIVLLLLGAFVVAGLPGIAARAQFQSYMLGLGYGGGLVALTNGIMKSKMWGDNDKQRLRSLMALL